MSNSGSLPGKTGGLPNVVTKKWFLKNSITGKVMSMVLYVLLGCGVSYKKTINKIL